MEKRQSCFSSIIFSIILLGAVLVLEVNVRGNGVARIWAQFPPGQEINDGVRLRYNFLVVANESVGLKLLFGNSRFYGTGADTYLMEYNLYTDRYEYTDPVCTTWPLRGEQYLAESSLRVAVPDYIRRGLTGAKTLDPDNFPRQTYLIDNIPGLWKTDMISQFNGTGLSGTVEIARGDLITDLQDWKCDGDLDPGTSFREWDITVTMEEASYAMMIALPEAGARYISPNEVLVFASEFFNQPGLFKIYLWDMAVQREGVPDWQSINLWKVVTHDGSPTNFGFKKTVYKDLCVIEVSNEPPGPYFPLDTVFDMSTCP